MSLLLLLSGRSQGTPPGEPFFPGGGGTQPRRVHRQKLYQVDDQEGFLTDEEAILVAIAIEFY
jgi:hypothetical protein